MYKYAALFVAMETKIRISKYIWFHSFIKFNEWVMEHYVLKWMQ